ncbi:hypothetical protein LXL04_026974 [Taraxacum kok-saghyz]
MAFGIASDGAVGNNSGACAASPKPFILAITFNPSSIAFFPLTSTNAAAPSLYIHNLYKKTNSDSDSDSDRPYTGSIASSNRTTFDFETRFQQLDNNLDPVTYLGTTVFGMPAPNAACLAGA